MDTIKTTEIVLIEYFDFHPQGVTVSPGIIPPREAFEALGFYISTKADEIRWQTGAWCNLFIKYYGVEVYERTAAICLRKPQTVEIWAYVERNVPPESRIPGLTMEFHRLVAGLKDPKAQKLYLRFCRFYGLRHSQFEQWLKNRGIVEMSQPAYRDRLFETEREAYEAEVKNQELETENHRLQQRITQLEAAGPLLPPPSEMSPVEAVNHLSRPLADWLGRTTGYSSVTVYRDGRIVIKPLTPASNSDNMEQ